MKKKKVIKTAVFSVVALILISLILLCVRYRDTVRLVLNGENIKSFVNSQRYSREDIEEQIEENKEQMQKIAEQDPRINIRGDLTEEEAKALAEGRITSEEAISIVKGDKTLDEILSSKSEGQQGGQDKPPVQETVQGELNTEQNPGETVPNKDRPSEIIAELYVLQAEFIAKLEALGSKAYEDYKATKLMSIVDSYTGEAGDLEIECDTRVKALLEELDAELTKTGGDKEIIKEIRKHYYKEKSLKKTYYLNKLKDD